VTAGDARDADDDCGDATGADADHARVGELQHADKLITLGQLAASAAHDINGQLIALQHYLSSAIRYTHTLQARDTRQLAADELGQLVDALAEVREAALNIATTTREMTTYARDRDAQFVRVRLDEIARLALRMTEGYLRDKAEVSKCLEPVPPLLGRSGALTQLVVNLLMNAGQALHASGRRGVIRIETASHAGSVQLCVQDDGPGIPGEIVPNIFEPYFTTKAPGHGTGLGLAICRDTARSHGGDVTFEPSARGARFVLRLPLPADTADTAQPR
jgi:C4-dicarboxylate-specific signal transduction histidine kinase